MKGNQPRSHRVHLLSDVMMSCNVILHHFTDDGKLLALTYLGYDVALILFYRACLFYEKGVLSAAQAGLISQPTASLLLKLQE